MLDNNTFMGSRVGYGHLWVATVLPITLRKELEKPVPHEERYPFVRV